MGNFERRQHLRQWKFILASNLFWLLFAVFFTPVWVATAILVCCLISGAAVYAFSVTDSK